MKIPLAIATALQPPAHQVCGVTLQPMSIGHWLHLTRHNVSFVTGAESHTLGDLLLGVLICSESYEGFTEGVRRGGVERAMVALRRALSGGYFGELKRWIKRKRGKTVHPREIIGFNLAEECLNFEAYIDAHGAGIYRANEWSIPDTATNGDGKSLAIKAPFPMVLLDALRTECGIAESEALNMPLPYARWRQAIHNERMGRISLIDREELQADQQEANQFAAEIFQGGQSNG